MPGARAALDRLRAAGLRLGVVTNQSGLARGRFTPSDLDRVHARIEELLGPFDTWQVCPHDDGGRLLVPQAGAWTGAGGRPGARHSAAAGVSWWATSAGTWPPPCRRRVRRPGADRGHPAAGGRRRPAVAADLPRRSGPDPAPATTVRCHPRSAPGRSRAGHVLVVRADSAGDVLLTGPAIRAVAAGADRVTLLCGPRGRAAAQLLPGVDAVIEHPLPWIDPKPTPLRRSEVDDLVARLAAVGADEALIFTSFHQSAAAAGAGAADGRRTPDRGDQRRLPGLAAGPAAPGAAGPARDRTGPLPRRGGRFRAAARRRRPAAHPCRRRRGRRRRPATTWWSIPAPAWPPGPARRERCGEIVGGARRGRAPGGGHRRAGRARR